MVGVPAVCLRCGTVFDSGFGVGPGHLTTEGCSTSCRCGAMAAVLDGTFTASGDVLHVLEGSTFTRTQVDHINSLKKLVLSGRFGKDHISDEIVEAVRAVSPELGALAKVAKKNGLGLAAILFILVMILKQCGHEGGGPLIEVGTHITQVYNGPVTEVEKSVLYYPHDPSKKTHQEDAQTSASGAQSKKNKR